MPQDELESLARAMDHSLPMAHTFYQHIQHKLIADPSHKIKHLLQINQWQEEEQRQLEDEFNEELEDGGSEASFSATRSYCMDLFLLKNPGRPYVLQNRSYLYHITPTENFYDIPSVGNTGFASD